MRQVEEKDVARAARWALAMVQDEAADRVPLLLDEVLADEPDAGPVMVAALAWLAGQVTIAWQGQAGAEDYLLSTIARFQDQP